MALNEPYLPAPVNVASSGSTTFDGTDATNNRAIVSGVMGDFDAQLFVEAWDGSAWQEVTQLTDADGNLTFSAGWHTQYNRLYVAVDSRRLRIDNVDSVSGWTAVEGDER